MMHSPTPEENVDTVEGGYSRPHPQHQSCQPQAYVTQGSRGPEQPVGEEGEESDDGEEECGYWQEDPSIIFRPLRVDDLHEIKAVHEELFPVRYNMSFYESVVRGYMPETRAPLHTLVAVDLSCPAPEFDPCEEESNIYEVVSPLDPDVSVSDIDAPVSEVERRPPMPSPEPSPPSAADSPTSPHPPSPASQEMEAEWRRESLNAADTRRPFPGLTSVPRRILPVDSASTEGGERQDGWPHKSDTGFPQRQRTSRRLRMTEEGKREEEGGDSGLEPSNIQVNTSMGTPARRRKRRGRIVGVIIAQVTSADRCGDKDLRLWPPNLYTEVLYILTLGTLPGYRRRGLAQVLLRRCMAAATTVTLGAVYLHVITYNTAAIRFYEANKFHCLRTLPEYYVIQGVRYDSYLYIRYLNGAINADRATWLSIVFRPILRLAHTIMTTLLPFSSPPRLANLRRTKRPPTSTASSSRREKEDDLERLV